MPIIDIIPGYVFSWPLWLFKLIDCARYTTPPTVSVYRGQYKCVTLGHKLFINHNSSCTPNVILWMLWN